MSRLTIGRLMVLVAIVAVGLGLYPLLTLEWGYGLAALAISAVAVGVISTQPDSSRLRRWTLALWRAALAVYLPCLLGLILVRDCSHCVVAWLRLWPFAFGLIWVHLLLRWLDPRSVGWYRLEWQVHLLGGIMTAALIVLVAGLGLRSRRLRHGSLGALAVVSLIAVWLLSAAIRS